MVFNTYICSMLQTRNLHYQYDVTTALTFPDMTCQAGEHWLLLGNSGCGKTTLLHLLGGLRTPKQGSVQIGNTVLNMLPNKALDSFRGKNIGIIFQQSHFVQSLNVEENLLLAQQLAGVPKDRQRVRDLLAHLQLGHKLKSKPNQLSQGEQQRVAIARAIVNKPQLILADEPTSALDDKNTEQVIQLLEQQALAVNATLLVVTHDARLKNHFQRQIHLTPPLKKI